MRFIKAEEGPDRSVIYTTEDGKQFMASSGDRNWRNNNPGNLKPGSVSRRNGQIGVAGGFAVFPDPETGHKALLDSPLNAHGKKSLAAEINDLKVRIRNQPGSIQLASGPPFFK